MELSSSNTKKILTFPKLKHSIFSAQDRKIKKNHREKISYTSGDGNPDKIYYIFSKKAVLIFRETENLKKKIYISGNGTLPCFGKGIFRTLAY